MIRIEHLSKRFKIYDRHLDRLKEWVTLGRVRAHRDYWALKDLTLNVPKGSVYGLVGMNGAGKSTLLKILTGTLRPTSGTCKINGRVSALLELGAGFHPELTGRENVMVNGRLHGLTSDEVRSRLDEIKDFSELGDYFDQPVRTYSSGMYVRLAFATASAVRPDILIIDEALSVGDAHFQQKCLHRIKEFKEQGMTILFVSHDISAVKLLCDRAALLDTGSVVFEGTPVDVLDRYNGLLSRVGEAGHEYVIEQANSPHGSNESGNFKAVVEKVDMLDGDGKSLSVATSGQNIEIHVHVRFKDEIENPTVGILIRDRLGLDVFGINTFLLGMKTKTYKPGELGHFKFIMPLDLGVGSYTISTAVHASMNHTEGNYHWIDRIFSFNVAPDARQHFVGVARLHPKAIEI